MTRAGISVQVQHLPEFLNRSVDIAGFIQGHSQTVSQLQRVRAQLNCPSNFLNRLPGLTLLVIDQAQTVVSVSALRIQFQRLVILMSRQSQGHLLAINCGLPKVNSYICLGSLWISFQRNLEF